MQIRSDTVSEPNDSPAPEPVTRADRRRVIHRGMLAAAGALVPVLLVLLLWKGSQAFLLLFVGYLVAVLLRALIRFVRRHTPLSHRWAFAVVVLGLLVIASAVGLFAAPRIDAQVKELSRQLPQAVDQLLDRLEGYEWVQWIEARIRGDGGGGGAGPSWLQQSLGIFSNAVGAVAGFLIIVWAGLYLAFDPALYRRGLMALVPHRRRERVGEVFSEADDALGGWVLGKVLAMLLIGILTWIGLMLLDIPLAFTLALLAALLTFIPNFGPILSTVPPALLALAEAPIKALWVILLFAGIQLVESYLVTPIIQREVISMPPALILFSQILLTILFGFLGLVVATPLAAAVLVLVNRLYVENVLQDQPVH